MSQPAPCAVEGLSYRKATKADVETVVAFINRMAEYEKMTDVCHATVENIGRTVFDEGAADVEFAVLDGQEVGFVLYYPNYSTFEAKPGIHLEELFVLKEHRGKGIGKALLHHVAQEAVRRGCGRLEWWCLDWNTPSRRFYEKQGAKAQEEWVIYRMDGEQLASYGAPER